MPCSNKTLYHENANIQIIYKQDKPFNKILSTRTLVQLFLSRLTSVLRFCSGEKCAESFLDDADWHNLDMIALPVYLAAVVLGDEDALEP